MRVVPLLGAETLGFSIERCPRFGALYEQRHPQASSQRTGVHIHITPKVLSVEPRRIILLVFGPACMLPVGYCLLIKLLALGRGLRNLCCPLATTHQVLPRSLLKAIIKLPRLF